MNTSRRNVDLVKECLDEGEWVSLQRIMDRVYCRGGKMGTAAVTARIRDLRKPFYGAHTVECRVRGGMSEYRLHPTSGQQEAA